MKPEEQAKLNNALEEISTLKSQLDSLLRMSDVFYRMSLADKFLLQKPLVTRNTNIIAGGRIMNSKGTDVVAANDLVLGEGGNQFSITGNTQINAIMVGTWQKGSKITLIFAGTPTVKHNTAGGTGTAKILLLGSIDLVGAVSTVLCLEYDGTVWQETSRKVA